jgi:hypothetical protein
MNSRTDDIVAKTANSIPAEAQGALGIAVAIVLPSGEVRTLYAWGSNGKLPLLAGLTLLTHDVCVAERKASGIDVEPLVMGTKQ